VDPAVPGGGTPATQHRHINPKRGQDQRHPQQGEQHDRETSRPPLRQLIAYRDGEDDDQQASGSKGRNLCSPRGRGPASSAREPASRRQTASPARGDTRCSPRCSTRPKLRRTVRPEGRQALPHGAASHPSQQCPRCCLPRGKAMAMLETASIATIIAGGVNAGRVDGDAVPRSRAGAATVLGSALRWPSPYVERSVSWPDLLPRARVTLSPEAQRSIPVAARQVRERR